MKRLIFFVLGFVLAFAMLINTGCATVQNQRDPLGIIKQLEKELKNEGPTKEDTRKIVNSVTLRNKTPFEVNYAIIQTGPNYAPFYIDKNLRNVGWLNRYGTMVIKDVPIGHYWAVFRLGPRIVHLRYVVNGVKPTVIDLTYNVKKAWANYVE